MEQLLRIAGIVEESIVDGPGIRYAIFTQGCRHHCEGCHNPHTHSFEGGRLIAPDALLAEIRHNPLIAGVTFSGGEPFEQADVLAELAKKLKQGGYHVMAYSGFTYEQLYSQGNEDNGWHRLLKQLDILVDGRFERTQKNLALSFRGSENQRIIDVKKSLSQQQTVECCL